MTRSNALFIGVIGAVMVSVAGCGSEDGASAAALTGPGGPVPTCYRYEEVNVPDGSGGELYTSWMDINERGLVAGNHCVLPDCSADANGDYVGAALYDRAHDTFETFTLPAPYNWVGGVSVNNRGEAAGQALVFDPSVGFTDVVGFFRNAAGEISILHPPSGEPLAWTINDLNDHGAMVGYLVDTDGRARGFILDGDVYAIYDATETATGTQLGGIDNRGVVAGYVRDGALRSGFVDDGSGPVFFSPEGPVRSNVEGLSGNGIVAGYVREDGDPLGATGFLWRDGAFELLAYEGAAFNTHVLGVNNRGTAVGTYDFFSFGLIIDPVKCDE